MSYQTADPTVAGACHLTANTTRRGRGHGCFAAAREKRASLSTQVDAGIGARPTLKAEFTLQSTETTVGA
jgi:hypothetical protein